jgi:DNA-binding CsgD family transcriptional regulator
MDIAINAETGASSGYSTATGAETLRVWYKLVAESVEQLHASQPDIHLIESYLAALGPVRAGDPACDVAVERIQHTDRGIAELAASCRQEMLIFRPARRASLERPDAAVGIRAGERGIRVREIHQHALTFTSAQPDHVHRVCAAGVEVRTVPDSVPWLLTVDRSAVMIIDAGGEVGTVIRHPGAAAAIGCMFDSAWADAIPACGHRHRQYVRLVADDIKRAIIRLMVDGLTDETISNRLGISVRTCRKHIAEIMRQVGATSRFQAGFMLGGLGLVEEAEDIRAS